MSKYRIERYSLKLFDKWNTFVENSNNGTIFHRLDFLSYHGEKFKDNEHHLIWYKGETIFAVMPMAVFEVDEKIIAKSPYAASFGGIVYSHKLKLKHAIELIELLVKYSKDNGINELIITLPPLPYHTVYSNYIEFALISNSFVIVNRDVFSTIVLPKDYNEAWNLYEGRTRTTIKKHNAFIVQENVNVADFYPILLEDKKRHNNAIPTHSYDDLEYLKEHFNKSLIMDIAIHKETGTKAGICYFICNDNTIMTFYMAQENKARGLNGVNILVDYRVKKSIDSDFKYFDFGSLTIDGKIQNIGVADFKESFGAKGYFRSTYKWEDL